jgi:hypothetical protein
MRRLAAIDFGLKLELPRVAGFSIQLAHRAHRILIATWRLAFFCVASCSRIALTGRCSPLCVCSYLCCILFAFDITMITTSRLPLSECNILFALRAHRTLLAVP